MPNGEDPRLASLRAAAQEAQKPKRHYITLIARDGAQRDIVWEGARPPEFIRMPLRPKIMSFTAAMDRWEPVPDGELYREYRSWRREAETHWIYREEPDHA